MKTKKMYTFKNAAIRFQNFSGRAEKYNTEGNRKFELVLTPEEADMLAEEGCTIRKWKKNEDEIIYTIKVKVVFNNPFNPDPTIYMLTSRGATKIDESIVSELDRAEIANIDLTIILAKWNTNGKSGSTAYLRSMYVTLVEDELENEYYDTVHKRSILEILSEEEIENS